jgi:Phosphogluconate dehydrogenase (decarboxylating) C-term
MPIGLSTYSFLRRISEGVEHPPTLHDMCMIGALLKAALQATVNTVGVPEAAAGAMLLGNNQVALANTLRGSNLFSDACS